MPDIFACASLLHHGFSRMPANAALIAFSSQTDSSKVIFILPLQAGKPRTPWFAPNKTSAGFTGDRTYVKNEKPVTSFP
ncbi:MAG: hypothetical protein ACOCS6_03170 [Desulfosalsimonas sp.]